MKLGFSMAVLLTALAVPVAATADVLPDDFSRCLVSSTSERDRADLVRWIFSALSRHPSITEILTVSEKTRVEQDKKVAKLMVRLLTVDCAKEAEAASKVTNRDAFGAGFGTLGKVAMQSMMSDAGVQGHLTDFTKYIDKRDSAKLGTLRRAQ